MLEMNNNKKKKSWNNNTVTKLFRKIPDAEEEATILFYLWCCVC